MKNPKRNETPKGRMRKAAISTVCSVVLVTSMCPAAALAQVQIDAPDDQLSVVADATYAVDFAIPTGGSSTVQAGETFNLVFKGASTVTGTKIACAQVNFKFDTTKCQIDKYVVPDGVNGQVSYDNEKGAGLITFYGNDTESIEACTITFKALDGVSGDAGIAITSAGAAASQKTDLENASFSASAGITINNATDISTVGINDPGAQFYTGEEIQPLSGSTKTKNAGRIYEGTDYTVEYKDNVGKKGETTTATAVVTGIGKYKGTVEITFDITQYKLTLNVDGKSTVTITRDELEAIAEKSDDNADPAYYQYGSSSSATIFAVPKKQYVTIATLCDAVGLTDFTSVVATASDGFSTTVSKDTVEKGQFYPAQTPGNVLNAEGAVSTPAILALQWDNTPLTSGTSMSTANDLLEDTSDDSVVIRILMGATAEDFAKGSYAGNRFVSNVNSLNFVGGVEKTDISTVGINDPGAQFYTGEEIQPLSGSTKTKNAGRIYEGTDYTVEYKDNVGKKGETTTATAVVTGIGKYKGTVEITFDITQYELSLNIDGSKVETITRDELAAIAEKSTDNTKDAYYQYGSSSSSTIVAVPKKQYVTINALLKELGITDYTTVKASASDGFSTTVAKETIDNGQFYPAQTPDNVLNAEGAVSTPAILALQWDSASLTSGTSMSTANDLLKDTSDDSLVIRIFMGATAEDFAKGDYAGKRYVSNVTGLDVAAVRSGVDGFVDRLYNNVLGRVADAEGKVAQIEGMKVSGAAQITFNFYNSAEFKAKSATMTNEEIVENVYQTLLNRPSDPDGKAMWTKYLDNGMSACALVAGFAESDEFKALCAEYEGVDAGSADWLRANLLESRDKKPGVTSFVYRLYTIVLNRDAEVDGLNVQCQALIDGTACWDMATRFFNSQEYINFAKTDTEFVADCYKAMMDREGTESEIAAWVARMDKEGLTRVDVVKGFCQSDEFEAICQSCGMTSGMR